MRMKSLIYIFTIALVLVLNAAPCFAQGTNIPWYSFNMGYNVASSNSNTLHSVVGQVFIGQIGNNSTNLQSGFFYGKQILTSIENGIEDGLPNKYILSQNYPNPFNPETVIEYSIPKSVDVSLVVYNLIGEKVFRLVNGQQSIGYHKIKWDASNVSSGIYFYRLQAGNFIQTRKMVLLK